MISTTLELTLPWSGEGSLLPLARALLDASGLAAVALPEAIPVGRTLSLDAGDGRVVLGADTYQPDPYAGGPTSDEWMRVEGLPGRALRVSLADIVWVGPELTAWGHGPQPWVDAVQALAEAHARGR